MNWINYQKKYQWCIGIEMSSRSFIRGIFFVKGRGLRGDSKEWELNQASLYKIK